MKPFLVFILGCAFLVAADQPSCYTNNLVFSGGGADTFRLQVRDNLGVASYSGIVCADDPTMTSLADCRAFTNVNSTAVFNIPNGPWTDTTGTINLKDGNRHHLFAKITNSGSFPAGVTCITGNGWPYKWDTVNTTNGPTYDLYTSVSSVGATPANTALVVNLNDANSTGTAAGNPVYTVGATTIYDNGFAGYYGQKRGISQAHVHTFPGGTSVTISATAMATAYAALSPAFGSDEQYIAVAEWAPFRVSGLSATSPAGTTTALMSITSYFSYGGPSSFTTITVPTNGLVQGQANTANGMFLTSSKTPFTDYSQRPAFFVVGSACTSSCSPQLTGTWTPSFANAKAWIDASVAGDLANPTGGLIVMTSNVSDSNASGNYLNSAIPFFGTNTGIAPSSLNIVSSHTAVANTFSTTGLLGYSFSTSNVDAAATPAFIGGYGAATTSFTGVLDGSSQQTQAPYWLNQGAFWSCGSVIEPFGLVPQHYPDMFLQMSLYTRGATAVESAWHAMKDPATSLCVGDPLAHQFSPSNPPVVNGGYSISGNLVISGGVH